MMYCIQKFLRYHLFKIFQLRRNCESLTVYNILAGRWHTSRGGGSVCTASWHSLHWNEK